VTPDQPQARKRSHLIWWLCGMVLCLLAAAALFYWKLVVPIVEVNRAVGRCEALQMSEEAMGRQVAAEAKRLGGNATLANYLRTSLRAPAFVCRSQVIAASMLAHCGKPAVPVLIEALEHQDLHVRINAASALIHIGPEAVAAVPALIARLGDADANTRYNVVVALGRIGDARAAVPLKRMLKDRDREIRQAAAEALKKVKTAQEKQ
jgi:HEAT repeat protein